MKSGHVDHVAGLQRGRLGGAGDGVAADARVALDDLEVHGVGQGHADGLAVEEQDVGGGVVLDEVLGVAHLLDGQEGLLVVLVVHEVVVVAVAVEVLHLLLLDVGLAHHVAGLEGPVDGPAGDAGCGCGSARRPSPCPA